MIKLYSIFGKAYVWNDNDWYELRTKHRICGALVGTIASFPRQNDYAGLPLELLPEEAAMLIENNVCELLDAGSLLSKPDEELLQQSQKLMELLNENQTELLKEKRVEQIREKIDLIMAGKKKKLISKGEPITEETLGREALLQDQIDKLPPLAASNRLLQIPTQHPFPLVEKKFSVKDLSGLDTVRCAVFKDLWCRGHYITNGSKFGGDFLVYPGEPVKFHASYIVLCVPSVDTLLRPTHIVALGRLAVAVNKRGVLATLAADGEVLYQTVQWHDVLID